MKNSWMIMMAMILSLSACKKDITGKTADVDNVPAKEFVKYTIKAGEHFSDKNTYAPVTYTELKFVAKFDSTAIYLHKTSSNQADINKLYGFSDNNAQHHLYSARFGWRWKENAIQIFGYVYNDGIRTEKYLGDVAIGAENNCSILVKGSEYMFILNGVVATMPRASTTAYGSGYKLYPYFGGDEKAPHNVYIWIKE
jgi:hypothetical protein